MIIYLAGPINDSSDKECFDWRNYCKEKLNPNHSTLDPMTRDYRGKELDNIRSIVEDDKKDIDSSDIILVNYFKPSVGTSMETYYAWSIGKLVYIINNSEKPLSPWLLYHSNYVFNRMDKAINFINTNIILNT